MQTPWLNSLRQALPETCLVHWDEESLDAASRDETEDLSYMPQAVVEPSSSSDVSAVMKWASEFKISVTAAGALTGLSGGALAIRGGIALSLKRMNQIVAIDTINQQVRVQPGVIVQTLQDAVSEKGLFYAVDPASRGSCTIGGNIAENSGGPRAVKYGVTKDWVLNLEVVLADGTILKTGADTLKNSTGYNLTQLMVGSEGTLGIVTEATLKLLPLPTHQALMLVPFESAENACAAVAGIFQAGVQPSALEFMERDAVLLAQSFTNDYSIEMPANIQAHLLVEMDAFRAEDLMPQVESLLPVLEKYGSEAPLFADDEASKNKLWFLRRRVGEAVKAASVYKEEDTVVPRGKLPNLLAAVKSLGDEYGFQSICYGHAGDGNLHVNILKGNLSDAFWNEDLPRAIRQLFEHVALLGGTISGEHGIGLVQKEYMDVVFTSRHLQLMRAVKRVFDPEGILNPGKIWPD